YVLGGGLTRIAANTAMRAGTALAPNAPLNPTAQAFKNLGMDTNLSGTVSGSPTLQFIEAGAARSPATAGFMRSLSHPMLKQWEGAVDQAADQLGPSETPQQAGNVLRNAADNWLNGPSGFRATDKANYDALEQRIPSDYPTDISNTQNAISDLAKKWNGIPNVAKLLQPKDPQAIENALTLDAPNGTIPWGGFRAMRTQVNNLIKNPNTMGDMDEGALKHLRNGMTADLQNAATQTGNQGLFNAVNAYHAAGRQFMDDHLNDILNAGSGEEAYQAATRGINRLTGGGTRLQALEQNMPGSTGDIGAVTMRNAARTDAGDATPVRFSSTIGRLS